MPTKYTAAELAAVVEGLQKQRDKAQLAYTRAVDTLSGYNRALREAQAALRLQRERDAKNAVARDRRKARALAEEYGVVIEYERMSDEHNSGLWWVLGPKAIYGGGWSTPEQAAEHGVRHDPCAGDHGCYDWAEILEAVETYVADIKLAQAVERVVDPEPQPIVITTHDAATVFSSEENAWIVANALAGLDTADHRFVPQHDKGDKGWRVQVTNRHDQHLGWYADRPEAG